MLEVTGRTGDQAAENRGVHDFKAFPPAL